MQCQEEKQPTNMISSFRTLYADSGVSILKDQDQTYEIRKLSWNEEGQTAYQRLRANTFVHSLGWSIPIDEDGRERDRYDEGTAKGVSVHCVYKPARKESYLLGGIRIFELGGWNESMVTNEFHHNGMIPDSALDTLLKHYEYNSLLELTRFCILRDTSQLPLEVKKDFNKALTRDYTYATAYALAEKTGRKYALGITNFPYLRIAHRSHFVFEVIYSNFVSEKSGYALITIDLPATVRAIQAAGQHKRANRMLALCQSPDWVNQG